MAARQNRKISLASSPRDPTPPELRAHCLVAVQRFVFLTSVQVRSGVLVLL
jgi:hypothetical protein